MRGSDRVTAGWRGMSAGVVLLAMTAFPLAGQNPETLMGSTTAGTGTEVPCGTGRVLVGVTGRTGMWITNLFLICAKVSGGTLSDAKTLNYNSQRIGGLASEFFTKAYTVRCPAGQVAAGVMVYRGSFINQVGLYCRVWSATGFGGGNLVGPGGGSGGSFDARTCSDRTRPVTALHAREGSFIDALGIRCRVP